MQRNPIEEIQECQRNERPLPGVAYRDADVFSLESDTIFRNSWISVACGQNVAERGDVLPVRIAGRSLLVVRSDDDEIRVFYNLCRHRGASLADAKCNARAGRIVCPYHAWTFGIDGAFIAAPHFDRNGDSAQPSAEQRKELGLLAVRTAVWRDIVFVNLSSDAQSFEDFIRPLDQQLAKWTATELRPASSDEYEIQANWKLAAENFLDVYHLPVVHSQAVGDFKNILEIEDLELSEDIVGVVLPRIYVDDSELAESQLPRFSGLGDDETPRVEVFAVFPNTLILVEADNQQVIVLRPQSAEVTQETFANYVVSDASQAEELAEERAELYQMSTEINDQDAVLLASLQATRSMDVGGDTHLNTTWDETNRRYQQLWSRRLLAGLA